MSAAHALAALTALLIVGVVVILVVALREVHARVGRIADGLDELGATLEQLHERDLDGLDGAVHEINDHLAKVAGLLPSVISKASRLAVRRGA